MQYLREAGIPPHMLDSRSRAMVIAALKADNTLIEDYDGGSVVSLMYKMGALQDMLRQTPAEEREAALAEEWQTFQLHGRTDEYARLNPIPEGSYVNLLGQVVTNMRSVVNHAEEANLSRIEMPSVEMAIGHQQARPFSFP